MNKKTFKKFLIYFSLGFGLIYLIIWLIFVINGPLPLGEGLNKSDWLIFAGGYLSFIGTISITYMVILQNKKFHEIEIEKLRYSQLPYFSKVIKSNIKEEFKKVENGYLLDCPSLINYENKLKWIGIETDGLGAFCPEQEVEKQAIYKIQNIGIGVAMKIGLRTIENVEYNYNYHCKIGDTIHFRVDLASLEKISQEIAINLHFFDIYNNEYTQKLICKFIIKGTNFTFYIAREQFEPILVKSKSFLL